MGEEAQARYNTLHQVPNEMTAKAAPSLELQSHGWRVPRENMAMAASGATATTAHRGTAKYGIPFARLVGHGQRRHSGRVRISQHRVRSGRGL